MDKLYKLIIFDVDGTLTETRSGATFRKTADDWKWLPGRLERLAETREQGIKIGLASNQGGVAFGYLDPQEIRQELLKVGLAIHAAAVEMCFSHPKATRPGYHDDSLRRKPGPGMLLAIIEDSGESKEDTLMVGDRPEDEQAAKNCGCDFMWAKDFFRDSEEGKSSSK